jgi:HK97 family phage prohead protease
LPEFLTRAYEFRAESIDTETREIVGIAVPYERDAEIGGNYVERIARDAVQDSDDALLFWRHAEPIGKLVAAENTASGWQIRARVSDTTLGTDALTLARDGVVTQLSIGFESLADSIVTREDGVTVITREAVKVREVSLVPFGAYADEAAITEVRERANHTERQNMADATTDAPDLTDVRERIDELERRSAQFLTRDDEPVTDTRSAAEILKSLAKGDEVTLREVNDLYERAYAGGTSADTVSQNGWVGDLTRIYDASSGVLASIFGTGTLPAQGMNVEYGKLSSNTTSVTEQADEGDDLATGKVVLTTATAPVKTYGGYVQLSRQEIERSSLPILQHSLTALAQAAGARQKLALRSAFGTVVTAQAADSVILGATLSAATYTNFINAIVDAAVKYDSRARSIDALVVSATVFKKLAGLAGSDGRPLMSVDGTGANTIGRLNVTALNGALLGVPVVMDAGASGDAATFVNGAGITVYTSPVVSLQDSNVINLSNDYSVYRYAAIAAEEPTSIVPLKLAAS